MTEQELKQKELDLANREKSVEEREKKSNETQEIINQKVDLYTMLHDKGLDNTQALKDLLDKNQYQQSVPEQTMPEQTMPNENQDWRKEMEDWKSKAEKFMMHIHTMGSVEILRRKVAEEIKKDSKGLEYVEKGLNDAVLNNLHHKLLQKDNKGLRGELTDLNSNMLNYFKRFDGVKPMAVEQKEFSPEIKQASGTPVTTPQTTPEGATTLPSHSSGKVENKKIVFKGHNPDYDFDKAASDFETRNPISNYADKP